MKQEFLSYKKAEWYFIGSQQKKMTTNQDLYLLYLLI